MKNLGVRVFVSYSHVDHSWVSDWLVPRLEAHGVRPIVDWRDFMPGLPALVNMERAVDQADATLLVLSPEWVDSEWTSYESLLAQHPDPIGLRHRTIPLLLRTCVFPRRLGLFTYADFRVPTQRTAALDRVLSTLPATFVRHGREVSRLGAFQSIFRSTTMIDRICFGRQTHYSEVDPPSPLALTWVELEPDIYTLLVDRRGRTRGYLNVMPVTDDLFGAILAGQIQDNTVLARNILPFGSSPSAKLYIMSLAVLPQVRGSIGLAGATVTALIDGFLQKLLHYWQTTGFVADELGAVAWTDSGIRLCELFRMHRLREDRHGHPVYAGRLREIVADTELRRRFRGLLGLRAVEK